MQRISLFLSRYKLVALLLTLFIIGASSMIVYPKLKTLGMNKFVSVEHQLNFYHPPNWEEIRREDFTYYNEQAKIGLTKKDSENTAFLIRIDDQPGATTFDVEGSIEGLRNLLSPKIPEGLSVSDRDVVIEYIRKTTFAGKEAIEAEYEKVIFTDPSKFSKFYLRQKQIVFLQNEKLYWLVFSALPEDFDKDLKDFNKMVDSLELP